MKVLKLMGEILLCFGIMLAILLIFKKFLGIERSVLPYAGGAAIGWCIGRRIIEMYFSKKKSR